MSIIFISYRRGDSAGHTGRLFDALRNRFGSESVFRDIDNLEPGIDFIEALDNALDKCDALLVVIGDKWISTTGSHGRRLYQPGDFVRTEIAKALERNVRVIPVLVADAKMPRTEELPEDLHALVRRNAIELSDTRWDYDVGRLGDTLAKVLGVSDQAEPGRVSTPPPPSPAAAAQQKPVAPVKKGGGMLGKPAVMALTGAISLVVVAVTIYSIWEEKPKYTAGWYGFSSADRDKELQENCATNVGFKRLEGPSGGAFDDLCHSIDLICTKVCDWEGNPQSCKKDPGDGSRSRIGYCESNSNKGT